MQTRWLATLVTVSLVYGCGSTTEPAVAGSDAATADVGDHDAGGDASSVAFSCKVVKRTCADITAAFASNASDVKVTCNESAETFTLQSTGVPTYMSNQTTPNAIEDQTWVVVLPLNPTCASGTPQDVVASRGPVGFMVNGIPFYGPEDAMGNDAVKNEGPSFDDCDGHADPSCSYHYHEEPICVFGKGNTAAMHVLPDGHTPVIGFALDGFAIHASRSGDAGSDALDSCGGHTDGTRGYHYHATKTAPYLVGCYAGSTRGTMAHSRNVCQNGVPIGGSDAGGG